MNKFAFGGLVAAAAVLTSVGGYVGYKKYKAGRPVVRPENQAAAATAEAPAPVAAEKSDAEKKMEALFDAAFANSEEFTAWDPKFVGPTGWIEPLFKTEAGKAALDSVQGSNLYRFTLPNGKRGVIVVAAYSKTAVAIFEHARHDRLVAHSESTTESVYNHPELYGALLTIGTL